MSYHCDKCNKVKTGTELKRVDIVREVTYNRNFLKFDRKTRISRPVSDASFSGTEIVSIERLCEECYEEFKDVPPRKTTKPKEVKFVGTRSRSTSFKDDREGNLDIKGLKKKWEGNK